MQYENDVTENKRCQKSIFFSLIKTLSSLSFKIDGIEVNFFLIDMVWSFNYSNFLFWWILKQFDCVKNYPRGTTDLKYHRMELTTCTNYLK